MNAIDNDDNDGYVKNCRYSDAEHSTLDERNARRKKKMDKISTLNALER